MRASTIYVRVSRDQFHVRNLETRVETTVIAQKPFTTARLLIGQFLVAEQTLRGTLKQVGRRGLFAPSPNVVIHPLEMIDGGLSEVEERVFREVVVSAGAKKVFVWVGHELSDSEVLEKLDGE